MKKIFTDIKEEIIRKTNGKSKPLFILFGILVLLILCFIIFIPKIQAGIRSAEVNSIVSQEKLNKKASYLTIETADQLITEKTAITVLFAAPSGTAYEKIMTVLKDSTKMDAFNHTIYVYPIIYKTKEIERKYNVKSTEPTVIFFEGGKEKNRITITNSFEVQSMLIPSLNQLPLASAAQTTKTSSTSTTQTTQK